MKLKLIRISLPADIDDEDVVPHFRFEVLTDDGSGMSGHFDIAIPMERAAFMGASIKTLSEFSEREVRRTLLRDE